MSSTDKFVRSSMKTSTAALCQAIGWDATQLSALDVLSDLYSKYFMEVAKRIHLYSEHAGRKDANLEDAALVFEDMNVTVGELEEYVAHFDPVPFPTQLPRFPVEKESHLNFLRPGSEEVLTRQVHVHEYMPPMVSDDDSMKKSKKAESEIVAVPAEAAVEEGLEEGEVLEERVTDRLTSQNGKLKNDVDTERTKDGADDSDSESSQSPIFSTKSPQSPITPKSGKRLDPSVENPALKRVRMLLEIEGNPVKEVTSVMMTSSGFLTTMREGKLPESKPPPNRDFFEPLVEKRKKIPTMKKIVEGVKKLDKERDFDRSESGLGLFEKPDSIYTTVPSFTGSARDKFDKEEDKVKEGKDRQKDKKDVSSLEKKKADKKSHKDEVRDKQKLKIFKKSLVRDGEIRVKAKHMQEVEGRLNDYDKVDAGMGKDLGLDDIDSEEDFANPKSREQSSMKKSKKKKDKLIAKYKQKKLQMASSRPLKLTKAQQKAMAAAALAAADPVKIFGTPDQIIKTVASQKKKRGRPKKMSAFNAAQNVLRLSSNLVKSSKLSRKQLPTEEIDIKSLVPDISINVKKVPLQPGLIPTSFSSSPVKLPNQLPPSISVTPATPNAASSPVGKDSSRHSGQFGALPSNVCSSVTITRIDMSSTQKLPTPFDNQTTPGIGSPNLNSSKSSSASSIAQSDSGITITPIVLEKQGVTSPGEKIEKGSSQVSGLAQLEQQFNIGKEQRKRDKEKRKELKKEKKKEKKEKDKSRKHEKLSDREREKTPKKEKKDKSEKKRKKEKEFTSHPEAVVPKLTLKLSHSATSTPVDSPNPPPIYHDEHHVLRKITIKPIEETKKQHQRSPSPPSEIARFSPLVTRPAKKVTLPKKSPAGVVKSRKQENDGFSQATSSSSSRKRGRGRPAKGNVKGSSKTPSVSGMQAGLVTETVGSYINEDGDKIWICPACGRQDDGSPMVGCEVCDDWYHFVCVGIEVEPDQDEKWYCKKCVAFQAKRRGRR